MILLEDGESLKDYFVKLSDIQFIAFLNDLNEMIEYDTRKRYNMVFTLDNGETFIDDNNQGKYPYRANRKRAVEALLGIDINELSLVKQDFIKRKLTIQSFGEYFAKMCPNDELKDYYFVLKMLNDDNLFNAFCDLNRRTNELGIDKYKYYSYLKILDVLFSNTLDSYGRPQSIFYLFCGFENYQKMAFRAYQIKQPINSEFRNDILSRVDLNQNKYDLVMSIYYELCKTLSYDQKYLFTLKNNNDLDYEQGERADKEYSYQVTKDNNQVICFEFNRIFVSILTSIGICARYMGMDHAYSIVEIEKNQAIFDPIKVEKMKNDFYLAKINKPLIGMKPKEDEDHKWETAIQKLNDMIEQKGIIAILSDYEKLRGKTIDDPIIDFEEAIAKFSTLIEKKELTDLDLAMFIYNLKNIGFFGDKVKLSFVMKKSDDLFDRHIIIYDSDYYFIIDTHKSTIRSITYEEVMNLLENKEIIYEDNTHHIEEKGRNL